jgi:DNA repair exonuclease SbcCD ATPase subunit
MLNFKTIRYKNFLSTGNYFTEIPLNGSQNTLIVGENGSGKSTVLDALSYALYNKPFRNINKPSLVNSINNRDTVVEVEFSADRNEYKIVRGIKPDMFEIYRNGVMIDQTASGDYQEQLEKFILKLNHKSFTQIVILGSASFTPFMQLKAAERREVIEDLLDIQIFSRMNKLVKNRQSTLALDRNSNSLKLDSASEKITMQERFIAEAMQDAETRITELEKELAQNQADITRVLADINDRSTAIVALNGKILDKTKMTVAIKKITQLEAQIESVLTKHKKTSKFYDTEKTCPTCIQEIAEAFKTQQIMMLGSKIGECETGLKQLEQKFLDAQKRMQEIEAVEQEISNHELVIATHRNMISQIERYMEKLRAKMQDYKTKHKSTGRERERLAELDVLQGTLEEEKKQLISEGSYLEAAGMLLKDTGIKTKIIRQYLPIINTLVNKYLAGMDFFVNFNLDETFKETIKSRHRDEFTYHSFSEGEKMRIDMALVLTWRAVAKLKNSADTNLLLLDEIFDSSLDNNGTEELMKILHNLDATNVFVISHRGDILQDKFASVIKFSKQQSFSRIVT